MPQAGLRSAGPGRYRHFQRTPRFASFCLSPETPLRSGMRPIPNKAGRALDPQVRGTAAPPWARPTPPAPPGLRPAPSPKPYEASPFPGRPAPLRPRSPGPSAPTSASARRRFRSRSRTRRLHFGTGAAWSSPACRALAPPRASGPWRAAAAGRRPLLPPLGLPAAGRRRRGLEGQSGGERLQRGPRSLLPSPRGPARRRLTSLGPRGRAARRGRGALSPSAALPCPPGSSRRPCPCPPFPLSKRGRRLFGAPRVAAPCAAGLRAPCRAPGGRRRRRLLCGGGFFRLSSGPVGRSRRRTGFGVTASASGPGGEERPGGGGAASAV